LPHEEIAARDGQPTTTAHRPALHRRNLHRSIGNQPFSIGTEIGYDSALNRWRQKMAIWKRLTEVDGGAVDVNLDQVAYLKRTGNVSAIYFVGSETDQGRSFSVTVKETPDDILNPAKSSSQPMGFG
jgi:hypothetical protein